jgi:hypothetical protein
MAGSIRSDEAREPVRYVCMTGANYCGSTLLALLLNAHPSCVSVGEITGPRRGVDLNEIRCSCGAQFFECDFYPRIAERMAELGTPFELYNTNWATCYRASDLRLLNALLARSLRNDRLNGWRDQLVDALPFLGRHIQARMSVAGAVTRTFARACLDLSGKAVFVDSSKDPQRPKWLYRTRGIDLRVIHLVKDVRAGTASFMKHHNIEDAAKAARLWRRANLEADRTLRQLPRERWLRVYYQDLCADPQGVLDRVTDFVGVARRPMPENFRDQEHHILVGNEMRFGDSRSIQHDTSWRARLSERDLDAIARVGGRVNRQLGFEWPVTA